MNTVFYRNRDDIILGLCSNIVNIANKHTDKFLDEPNSNKDNLLNYYAEYLSIIIHTIILKAEDKLEEEEYKYLVDEIFQLVTWLAVENRGYFLSIQQKIDLLKEIRQLCANRIDHYLKLPTNNSENNDESLRKDFLYNFAKEITHLDGSYPNIGAILGQKLIAVTMLKEINIDQFLQWYETGNSS